MNCSEAWAEMLQADQEWWQVNTNDHETLAKAWQRVCDTHDAFVAALEAANRRVTR